MSDLTPEVLDELERRATDAISMMGRASIVGSLQFMEAVEPHISDLIEAARERDRLDQLLKTEIEDNCEYDTEIRAMCNHVDDQYREPLPDVVQKVVEERDRLRAILAEARAWIASETEGATGRYASSLVGDIDAALERKDGDQCSTQQS